MEQCSIGSLHPYTWSSIDTSSPMSSGNGLCCHKTCDSIAHFHWIGGGGTCLLNTLFKGVNIFNTPTQF